ncbi:hypothetical protein AB0I90_27245 [Micromonospora wenchangensis]|uniref:hypothetical protein n=1 Tax=Micromonospora wenchangensis TaxID=1185415 RepID=UPI0033EAC535
MPSTDRLISRPDAAGLGLRVAVGDPAPDELAGECAEGGAVRRGRRRFQPDRPSARHAGRRRGTQTIYMNVSGSDSAAGDTPAAAVRTLGRVEQFVAAGSFNHDVEVRLHAGAYLAQQTIWQTCRPGV